MALLKSNFITVVFIFLILINIATCTKEIPECRFTGTCTTNYLEKEKDNNGNTKKKTLTSKYVSGEKRFEHEQSEIMKKSTAMLNDVPLKELHPYFHKSGTIVYKEQGKIIKRQASEKTVERILKGTNEITENSDDELNASLSTDASGDEIVGTLSTKASDKKFQPIYFLNLKEELIFFYQ